MCVHTCANDRLCDALVACNELCWSGMACACMSLNCSYHSLAVSIYSTWPIWCNNNGNIALVLVVAVVVAASGVQLLPSHCGEQHLHSLRGSTSHSQQQQPQHAEQGHHCQYP